MRKSFAMIVVLGAVAMGSVGISTAGDAESSKQYGLAQWTWEGREQTPERVGKEKHGLRRWTREDGKLEETGVTNEKYGLSRWTRMDRAKNLGENGKKG